MDVIISRSHIFDRALKRLAKRYASMKDDLISFSEEIRKHPDMGTSLGGRVRKARMAIASKGKGKRGGARVITYTFDIRNDGVLEIRFLYIYDKSERSTMTDKEMKTLVELCGS